jgi:hypothetical protein
MIESSNEEIRVLAYGCLILKVNVFCSRLDLRMTLGQPSLFGLMHLAKSPCKYV